MPKPRLKLDPIFILGAPRSGTSILTWCLGQHPNIIAVPETDWLTALSSWADSLFRIGMVQHPYGHLSRWDVSRDAFLRELGSASDAIIKRTFEARFPDRKRSLTGATVRPNQLWFRSVDDPKVRWVNGTPSMTGYANVLAAMYPEGRFINLVRDPVKVVQSLMGASFRQASIADTNTLVQNVYHSQRAGYLAHAAYEERAMRVIFEHVVANPEGSLRSILSFLDEKYAPDCIEPLVEKINSSGEVTQAVLNEYASLDGSALMSEMRGWYEAALDPNWLIEDRASAREYLAVYGLNRVPHPT